MRKLSIIAVVIAGATSGCASITGNTNQSVSVQTREQSGLEVAGAACELTNNKGKWFVTTPGSVMVHRSNDDMQVLCTKPGAEPGRDAIVSETKGSMFGNLVFGGGIGAVIDHSSGAAYEYPAFIQVLMAVLGKGESSKTSDQPVQALPVVTTDASPTIQLASDTSALNAHLVELKKLSESGLISQDIYLERQRKLLDARQ